MAEQLVAGQDENNDGCWALHAFSGWRWIPVRPFETVKTRRRWTPRLSQQRQHVDIS